MIAAPVDGVEVAGGLVGEQEARRARDGPRERDALLLAARELHGIVVTARAEPDLVEQPPARAPARRPPRRARAASQRSRRR